MDCNVPDSPIETLSLATTQQQQQQAKKLTDQLNYWQQRLKTAPLILDLPTDHSRPSALSPVTVQHPFVLPKSLSAAVKTLSRQEGVSLFTTLLTAWQLLLHRYSGQDDLLVGTPSMQYTSTGNEWVNWLVLRSRMIGNPPFRDMLGQVAQVVVEAQANQDVPFEQVVQALQPESEPSRHPLFQVLFVLEQARLQVQEGDGFTPRPVPQDSGMAKCDLSLWLQETEHGLRGWVEYNSALFDATTIERLVGHWQTLLEGIVAAPERRLYELPLLTEAERHQLLLVEWNDTSVDYPSDQCVHQLFEAQVERTPDAVALVFEQRQLTYWELNQRANQLAHYLQHLGVGPEVRVGLCVERSPEMVVGLLGILKAGAAYVPLDPTFPSERLTFMLEDSQAPVLVTQEHLTTQFSIGDAKVVCLDTDTGVLMQENKANPFSEVTSENLAYVIYTSGSTGRPKGVQIVHRAMINFLISMGQQPGLTADDRLLAITTLSFDIAALELFLPLITGACLIIASRDVVTSGTALGEIVARSRVTVMQATPVTWRMLLAAGWQGNPQLKILCGGEALPLELAQQLLPKSASLWNLYGPTETTIWSTVCKIEPEDKLVTIGRAIANTQLYILDTQLQLVPIGVPGELYIGGAGLARGYLNRPELTAERFISHPFNDEPGARLYKTGDLARYRSDGTIEHLGRLDYQAKIRGFRIELGEIEAVLSQHPAVRQAVVVVREDVLGDKRLVAYVVMHKRQNITINELQEHLAKTLPAYMLPSAFVLLEAMPLTPNNKVDRRALPVPDQVRTKLGQTFVAPHTPLEKTIATIWSQVLEIEQVGIHDNFFALGGHSVLAMQVISRLQATLQVEMPLQSFLEAPTVTQLAELLQQHQASGTKSRLPSLRSISRETYRVSSVPKRPGY